MSAPWLALSMALLLSLLCAQAQALDLRIPSHPGTDATCTRIWQRLRELMPELRLLETGDHATAARRDSMLLTGDVDADCGTIASPSVGGIRYSALPIYTVRVVLVARATDDIKVSDANALRRTSVESPILLNRGSRFRTVLEKLGVTAIDDGGAHTEQNVAKLLAGHGRLFIYQQPALSNKLRKSGQLDQVRVLPWSPGELDYRMAYSPHLDRAVVDRIEAALARLARQGELGRTSADDAAQR